jgi:hypothetical protein
MMKPLDGLRARFVGSWHQGRVTVVIVNKFVLGKFLLRCNFITFSVIVSSLCVLLQGLYASAMPY